MSKANGGGKEDTSDTSRLNAICSRRIMRDRILYMKSGLAESSGIYCYFSDEDIMNVFIMIIGPTGTPYDGGFYFFKLTYTNQYPFHPPNVTFLNQDKRIRFNPNFYIEGKVCLSILGTWAGPGWASTMNLTTIINTLIIRMNEWPIQNEPGFEKDTTELAINYNKLIKYYNFEYSVLKVMRNNPAKKEWFIDIMYDEFIKRYNTYNTYLSLLKDIDTKTIESDMFKIKAIVEYGRLKNELEDIKKTSILRQKSNKIND
jgi:ubiquitin-conjugating enzyme E2 Z